MISGLCRWMIGSFLFGAFTTNLNEFKFDLEPSWKRFGRYGVV